MQEYILTYDIGTTGNKCTVFNRNGKSLASVTIPYETEYLRPGWAQQNPEHYWESVLQGTQQLSREFPEMVEAVSCIGLSGHMNGMLPIRRDGTPAFPEVIHSDNRSAPFCSRIRERIDDKSFYGITGNRIDAHLSLPKMLWFKESYPGLYKDTAWFLQSKDFIAGRLTGHYGSTDYSDASLTCVLDLNRKVWSERIMEETGLNREKLPSLLHSHDRAGTLDPGLARKLGLKGGIPVFAGGGDASCSARGAGIGDYSTAQNYIGSSSWISVLSPEPMVDEKRRVQNFFDLDGENINVCGTVQCAGIALDWMMQEIAEQREGGEFDYREVEALASCSTPGASGLFFIPYLMGERTPHWNPCLKGGFVGLSLNHKREDLVRAVFEGIAYALKDVLNVFIENGTDVEDLSLTGGGALSPFWNQMMSSIYGRPVKKPDSPKQATSLGAAMAAGVGAGFYDSYKEAAGIVNFCNPIIPEKETVELYKRAWEIFYKLYAPYEDLSGILAEYQLNV